MPQRDDLDARLMRLGGRVVTPEVSEDDDELDLRLRQLGGRAVTPVPPRTISGAARDLGITTLKGFGAIPEFATGLADIPTLGYAGKFLKDTVGYDPAADRAALDAYYTPAQKEAFDLVSQEDTIGGTIRAAFENPSVIAHSVVESIPSMLAGGVAGRVVGKAIPALAKYSGAIGEGLVTAGQAAESTRQESTDGFLTGKQVGLSLASGAATSVFGAIGGRIAQRWGITDIDSLATGTVSAATRHNIVKEFVGAIVQEGLLEELPQSISETVLGNLAAGRPPEQGLSQSMVLGTLSGMVMGAGGQLFNRPAAPPATLPPPAQAAYGQRPPVTPPPAAPPPQTGPPSAPAPPITPPPAAVPPLSPTPTPPPAAVPPSADPVAPKDPSDMTDEEFEAELLRRMETPDETTVETPAVLDADDPVKAAERAAIEDEIKAAIEDLRNEIGGSTTFSLPAVPTGIATKAARVVGLYAKLGIFDAQEAWTRFTADFGEVTADVKRYFEEAWQAHHGAKADPSDPIDAAQEEVEPEVIQEKGKPPRKKRQPVSRTEKDEIYRPKSIHEWPAVKSGEVSPDQAVMLMAMANELKELPGEAGYEIPVDPNMSYETRRMIEDDLPGGDINRNSNRLMGKQNNMAGTPLVDLLKARGANTGATYASIRGQILLHLAGKTPHGSTKPETMQAVKQLAKEWQEGFDYKTREWAPEVERGWSSVSFGVSPRFDPVLYDKYVKPTREGRRVIGASKMGVLAASPERREQRTQALNMRPTNDADETGLGDVDFNVEDSEVVATTPEPRTPPTRRPPAGVPRADMEAERPRRNAVNNNALEDDLSPEARRNLDRMFKDPTEGRQLRHVREAMEIYGRLTDALQASGGEGEGDHARWQVVNNLLRATENYFAEPDKTKRNAWAVSEAAHEGLKALTGSDDPDYNNELLENEVFASAEDAAILIWDTLDPRTASFDTAEFNAAFGEVEFRKPADDIFPEPKERVIVRAKTKNAPAEMPQAEADDIVQSWKAEAKRIGEEEDHGNEVIISLFDRTGQWSQPYVDAGYHVRRFDIETGSDLLDFADWMGQIEEMFAEGQEIVGVMAAPPCTSFSKAGQWTWPTQHDVPNAVHEKSGERYITRKYGDHAGIMFDTPLDYANTLVAVVKLVVQQTNPSFYVMENPIGRIEQQNNLPTSLLEFDPNAYGEPETKETHLWGEFNPYLPTARVKAVKGSTTAYEKTGFNKEAKLARSETPEGFAYAFFMANHGEAIAKEMADDLDVADDTPEPEPKVDTQKISDDKRQAFRESVAKMAAARDALYAEAQTRFDRDGYVYGVSKDNPTLTHMLTTSARPEGKYQVTTFQNGEPYGHRAYDLLGTEERATKKNRLDLAFSEFQGFTIQDRPKKSGPPTKETDAEYERRAREEAQGLVSGLGKNKGTAKPPTKADAIKKVPARVTVYHGSAEIGRRGTFDGFKHDIDPAGRTREVGATLDSLGVWWTTSKTDASRFGQSFGPDGKTTVPPAIVSGSIALRNPRVFESAEEFTKLLNSLRVLDDNGMKKAARADAIRAAMKDNDGLIIRQGGKGDGLPEGGDYYLAFDDAAFEVSGVEMPQAAKKPGLTFGKKPPTKVKADTDQPRLPGDTGEVRDVEVASPDVADLPQQTLTLTGERMPDALLPKEPGLFDSLSEDARADISRGFAKVTDTLKNRKFSGIPVDKELIVGVGLIVRGAAKHGFVDAQKVWNEVQRVYGEIAGDLRRAFDIAWEMQHKAKPQIATALKPSKDPAEFAARQKALQARLQQQPELKPVRPPAPPAPKPSAKANTRELFGEELVGFGTYKHLKIKDLATQQPHYAIDLAEKKTSPRAVQIAEYMKDDPAFIRALGDQTNVTMTPEQLAALNSYGLIAVQHGLQIHLTGKKWEDTYERRDLIKAATGGKFDRNTAAWVFPAGRLDQLIADLGGVAPETGKARRKLAAHLTDPKLRALREAAARRTDRSGFDGNVSQYVSDRTAQALRTGGVKAEIEADVIEEQIEDVAKINRAYQRGQKGFVLASEPGTGKTFVLGGAIQELKAAGAKAIVYITPNNELIAQAKRDLKAVGFDLSGVTFITYAKFRETPPTDLDALIFDEAHNVKNVRAADASAQAIQGAAWMAKAKFTVMATATPYENPTQVQYLAPTGLFDEVFGEYHYFALAYGAKATVIDAENNIFRYDWERTTTSEVDQAAAREWLVKEGVYTSRRMRLPKDKVDTRMVRVQGDSANAKLFDAINRLKETARIPGMGRAWVTNFQKRVLEASKVQVAIDEAQKALDKGRFPIIFVETKAERIINVSELVKLERQYNMMDKNDRPSRKAFGLPPQGIVPMLAEVVEVTRQNIIHIPSAEDLINDHFGEKNVAVFTGSVSAQRAQDNLSEWREGSKHVLVATMAKGGTGLSLHDKVGDHQTTQINVNLPWTATSFVQVAQRSARYGMKGKAEMVWLFADNVAMDRELAARVGGRMADMGAIVHGERLAGSRNLQDWNFEDVLFGEEDGETTTSASSPDGGMDEDDDEGQSASVDPGLLDDEEDEAPKTYYDEEPTDEGDNDETPDGKVRGLELPELVELATDLIRVPWVRKRLGKMLGAFTSVEGRREGNIRIRADLYQQGRERELAQVLAHEIGHLIDWLPNYTLKRGNLLGRLRSLSKFLKGEFVKANGDIIENSVIRAELVELSDEWRPWDRSTATATQKKYRASGRELMADAMSALLTDPAKLQSVAPIFYKEFFEAMEQKPEVKRAYYALQVVMGMTLEDRNFRRLTRDRESKDRVGDKALDAERARLEKIRAKQWNGWWLHLQSQMVDKHTAVIQRVKQLATQGIVIPGHLNPATLLEVRNYIGGILKGWGQRNVEPLVEMMNRADISWRDFGLFLQYDREINDRTDIANPGGGGPKFSQEKLDALEKDLGAAKMAVIRRGAAIFRVAIAEVRDQAFAAGLYTPETYKDMLEAKAYATFRVEDYLDQQVRASIKRQVGTNKEIANAADSTILKMLVTLREIQNNKAKLATFAMLKRYFRSDIADGGPLAHKKAKKNPDLREVGYWKMGVYHLMYVDPLIADSLNNESIGRNNAVVKVVALVNAKLFRPIFTGINPGFMTFNVVRDLLRTWKTSNIPLHRIARQYAPGSPAMTFARVRAFGVPDAKGGVVRQTLKRSGLIASSPTAKHQQAESDLLEAEEVGGFSITSNEYNSKRTVADTEIEDIMQRYSVKRAGAPPREGLKKALTPLFDAFDFIKNVGDFIETLPKAAAMYEMSGDKSIGDLTPEQWSFIRRKVGTPDALAGGTWKPVSNEILLFSNIFIQAWKADIETATDLKKNPSGVGWRTPSGFWWKTASLNILPKMIMMAGALGLLDKLLGDWYRRAMEGVTEYDKTNYIIIPFGIDEKGQTKYLRLPQDDTGRLLGGLAWKALRTLKGDKSVLSTLAQIVDYTAGQTPAVTPSLGAVGDLVDYASGRNIYDSFRSRNVFTDDEWKARDVSTFKKFVGYEFQTLGGAIVWKFYAGETRPKELTTGQKILELPVLSNVAGRWIRITDFGKHEALREIKQSTDADEARHRRNEKAGVNDAIQDYLQLQPFERSQRRRMDLARQVVRDVYGDRPKPEQTRRATQVAKKIFLGAVRGEADPLVEEVMSAGSNAQAKAMIVEAKKSMSDDQYRSWVSRARSQQIISDQFASELRRLP